MNRYVLGFISVFFAVSVQAQTLQSGTITAFPLDLGVRYTVSAGGATQWCDVITTAELSCTSPLPPYNVLQRFHAVVATQGDNEFLLGCLSSDFQRNNWSCVNLTPGAYAVRVHSQTVVVLGDRFSEINGETGKEIRTITPIFSILEVQRK